MNLSIRTQVAVAAAVLVPAVLLPITLTAEPDVPPEPAALFPAGTPDAPSLPLYGPVPTEPVLVRATTPPIPEKAAQGPVPVQRTQAPVAPVKATTPPTTTVQPTTTPTTTPAKPKPGGTTTPTAIGGTMSKIVPPPRTYDCRNGDC